MPVKQTKRKTTKRRETPSFNPVKVDPNNGRASKVVWSTEAIDAAIEGLNKGYKLKANPFYDNNTKLLKSDLLFERTPEEMKRYKECMNDILEFAKECQLMTPKGIMHVKLRDYQEKYLQHLQNNRLSIYLACRQCAKTTTSAIFLLHYTLFNFDKNALVLGNKYKTAKEILDKIKNIFYYLPYYLRPGIRKWNDSEIVFDNGCRIMAEATTINSGISFTFHCILCDEFAHVAPNIVEKFYNQIFPTITAGAARFMITSTQNGFNLFYKLYTAAVNGENAYAPFKTDWYEVPEWNPEKEVFEPRTEEWHRTMAANMGGEEAFQKQFGTNFDITGNTLISAKCIRKIRSNVDEFRQIDMPAVKHSDSFKWSQEIEDINQLKDKFLTLTIDLAEGLGQDSDVMNIHELKWDSKLEKTYCQTIGICEMSDVNIQEFAETVVDFVSKYCNSNNTILSFEVNTFGQLFYKSINSYSEKHPELRWDDSVFARYSVDMFSSTKDVNDNNKSKTIVGFRVSSTSKREACKLFKFLFESSLIRNNYTKFITQMENFSDTKGNGSYAATFGHDDIIMTEVQQAALMQTLKFMILRSSFEEQLNISDDNNYSDFYSDYVLEDFRFDSTDSETTDYNNLYNF